MDAEMEIVEAIPGSPYDTHLYRCLAPMPFWRYKRRDEYIRAALPKGLRKRLLVLDGKVVGQIEYGPAEASGYPISGKDIIVMNCIWVLRRVKGRRLGSRLFNGSLKLHGEASGWATIGLEGHWSPWLRKEHMELLGFRSIDSMKVAHKAKHLGEPFRIHLMWLPLREDAEPPAWDRAKMLEGVTFCLAHPLYRHEGLQMRGILQGL